MIPVPEANKVVPDETKVAETPPELLLATTKVGIDCGMVGLEC